MGPEASDKGSVTVQISVLEDAELPQYPLWVRSRHVQCKRARLLYPLLTPVNVQSAGRPFAG